MRIFLKMIFHEEFNMYGELKKAQELFKNENGEYENVSYEYFLPEFLNKDFVIKDRDIYVLSEKVVKAIAELNADSKNLKNIDVFVRMLINQEAIRSSSIEGTRTTFSDILLPEDLNADFVQRQDRAEVINYANATFQLKEFLQKLPISERFISNLHTILLDSVRGADKNPGEIRKIQNWIGGYTIKSAKFIPPHWKELPSLLKDLCDFWCNDDLKLPILIKIALFHYQFETIHPFKDGNGRIGRLLILAQLLDSKMLEKPWFNVSYIFERNKEKYTEALKNANSTGNLELWIKFFLDSLNSAAQNTYKIYHDFNCLQNECSEKIINLGAKANNAKNLLNELYDNPYMTLNNIAEKLRITRQTAKFLADDLVRLDIVKPCILKVKTEKLTRNQQGIKFEKYIKLFE